jgi:rare lipoprotein A
MSRLQVFTVAVATATLILGTGCSTKTKSSYSHGDIDSLSPVVSQKDYAHPTMRPYVIRGIKYYPTVVSVGDEFSGNASWYGPDFHGKLTSNGEIYNMYDMTAAHKTLPMNTIVKVTNKRNGLSTIVRINDRGPFIDTRIIDLSNTAAKKIDMLAAGTAPVTVEIIGFSTNGSKGIPLKQDLKTTPQEQIMDAFAIQIGSFSKIEGALVTQKKYNDTDGYKTIIKDMQTQNGRMFKVWLKGFRSEQEAKDYIALGNFKDSFIVRED